jgi:hypothetical protein
MPGIGIGIGSHLNRGSGPILAIGVDGDWTQWLKDVLITIPPSQWPDYDALYAVDNFLYMILNSTTTITVNTQVGLLGFPGITNGNYKQFERLNFGNSRSFLPLFPSDSFVPEGSNFGATTLNSSLYSGSDNLWNGMTSRTAWAMGVIINPLAPPPNVTAIVRLLDNTGNELDGRVQSPYNTNGNRIRSRIQNNTSAQLQQSGTLLSGFVGGHGTRYDSGGLRNIRATSGGVASSIHTGSTALALGTGGGSYSVNSIWHYVVAFCLCRKTANTNTGSENNNADAFCSEFRQIAVNGNAYTFAGYPWAYNISNYPTPIY